MTTPQPTAAVDNLDVSALAAMFSRPSPKSEQEDAPSPANAHPDESASQPDTAPTDAQRESTAATDPASVTPPAQSPDQPETVEATPAEDEQRQAARALREFETPKFQKRVAELTAKVYALEAQLNGSTPATPADNGKPATAQAATAPMPPVQFNDDTLAAYDQRILSARQMIAVASANPDGLSHEGKDGQVVEFSGDQLRQMAAAATADLAALSAQREVRFSQLQAARESRLRSDLEAASATYPWIMDTKSEKYREATEILRQNPSLLAQEDVVWLVAGAVEAKAARLAGGAPKTKVPSKPTPVSTRPSGAPATVSSVDRELAEAEQRAERTGSTQDYQKVLALRARARQLAARGR